MSPDLDMTKEYQRELKRLTSRLSKERAQAMRLQQQAQRATAKASRDQAKAAKKARAVCNRVIIAAEKAEQQQIRAISRELKKQLKPLKTNDDQLANRIAILCQRLGCDLPEIK